MCISDNCDSPVLARGMCRKHYQRWYKYGDMDTVKKASEYVKKGKDSPRFKHGMFSHPLYETWRNMIDRCHNEKSKSYNNYGGRGITVGGQRQTNKLETGETQG